MIIRSKAPFRISFGGGGTDMAPYCIDHGGCVINTAIDRHVFTSIEPREDKKIRIYVLNLNKEKTFDIGDRNYSEEYELFKGTINVLGIKDGFNITTYSELPTGSGMGGSSSLCVALIGAFNEFYKYKFNLHDIALKAYEIERIELNQKGGYQDQFASAYGGFNFMEFTDKVKVTPVKVSYDMLNEMQYRSILCFVGGSHFSSEIQEELLKSYKIEKKSYEETMQDLKDSARAMRKLIEINDKSKLNEFGNLLHKGWLAKKSLSTKITNDIIDNCYLISRKYGVIGGKLLGAGGGGHLLLFAEPEKKYRIIQELERLGCKIIDFHFNSKGLEVWKV